MFMGICPYLVHLPQNSSCRELGERRDHRILTGKKRPTQIHSLSYTTVERRWSWNAVFPVLKSRGGRKHFLYEYKGRTLKQNLKQLLACSKTKNLEWHRTPILKQEEKRKEIVEKIIFLFSVLVSSNGFGTIKCKYLMLCRGYPCWQLTLCLARRVLKILLNCGQLQTGWTRLVWCSYWCSPSHSPREVNHKVNRFVPWSAMHSACLSYRPRFHTSQKYLCSRLKPPSTLSVSLIYYQG